MKRFKTYWKQQDILLFEQDSKSIKHNSTGDIITEDPKHLDNFWSWFGNSKMVDSEGRPQVWYHVTTTKFTSFDVGRGSGVAGQGIYLTNQKFDDDRYGDVEMQLYVHCENPLDLIGDDKINEHAITMGLVGLYDLRTIPQMREWSKDFRNGMLKLGYDGCFVMPQGGRKGEKHLVVYKPHQVKSVNNTGDFSNSDDIMTEDTP